MTDSLTQLHSLLERLEKAEGPDRGLDADIAVACGLGLSRGFYEIYISNWFGFNNFPLPTFTFSFHPTVALIELVLPGWSWSCMRSGFRTPAHARVWETDSAQSKYLEYDAKHNSGSPPLALLCALFRALIAMEEDNDVGISDAMLK